MEYSKTFGIPEAKGLKRGSKVKFSFVLHSFTNRLCPYESGQISQSL